MHSVRIIFLLLLAPLAARAGGDEVVVVYNTRSADSQAVAEHYASVRQVPARQIFGFALTTNEVMTRSEFTDSLQKPLAGKLVSAGLWKFGKAKILARGGVPAHEETRVVSSKIRYAVLCYGVPLKISPADLPETDAVKAMKPEFQRNEASVDSELAWLPLVKMNVALAGPLPNLLYGCTNQLMLSPVEGVLLVARLDGPTPAIANGLVDKARAAEDTGLWGRAYFDQRAEPTNSTYYLGDEWMQGGADICHRLGFDVETDTNAGTFPESFPMSQIAIYAGWYDPEVSGPFKLPGVEFMPGAFAYHLHSFSAETIRSTSSRWCGPLLADGATCTMGCVYEPYLQFTPNIAFFLDALGNGYTFGEAAWASQPVLSWQTTVIGDPLYQPFGRSPLELHTKLARMKSPLLEWSFERLVNLDLIHGAGKPQLEQFLENLPAAATSPVLTEKLANIYDELGKPASAVIAWQNALKLQPSPLQRIRIRRVLAEKLLALGRPAEAIDDYRALLAEAPDYPGKPEIEAALKILEQKDSPENKK